MKQHYWVIGTATLVRDITQSSRTVAQIMSVGVDRSLLERERKGEREGELCVARVFVDVQANGSVGSRAPSRLGPRELQLQLHARWGYAGLGRVRCTSRVRPFVRPPARLFSSPPTRRHLTLLAPPLMMMVVVLLLVLLLSSSSSFSFSPLFSSFSRSSTTSPFQPETRTC